MKTYSPHIERNRDPILNVLEVEFLNSRNVLEIGSGTGEHATYFAKALDFLSWQPSDRAENLDGIMASINDSRLKNLSKPIELDVKIHHDIPGMYDAVFSSNTAHIMDILGVQSMFQLVGDTLSNKGVFCLYGPFNVDGEYTSESNREFDLMLKSKNSEMGIRDIDQLKELGIQNNLNLVRSYAMPSNNMIIVWEK